MSINNAADLQVLDVSMDNTDGDVNKLGHNTDAFDVSVSSNIYISGAKIKNQDDCIAINSGTNITFTNADCSGGHGLSLGSVGNRVSNELKSITISNSKVSKSDNGVRIKTISGAKGSVSGVKFSNIKLDSIMKYGIVIEQDYLNGGPTGTPTNGVPITDLTLSSIVGVVDSSATNIYILCGKGSCSGWEWADVQVDGGQSSNKCSNVPEESGATC